MESKQHLCHSQFALVLLKLGRKNKDRVLIESSLSTCLELLCQSDPNNMCNRFRVPFILLDLDRDDDAYCFLKWWVIVDKVNKRRFATFYYIEMCYTYCSLKSCCSDDQATFILDLLNLTSLIKISIMFVKMKCFMLSSRCFITDKKPSWAGRRQMGLLRWTRYTRRPLGLWQR